MLSSLNEESEFHRQIIQNKKLFYLYEAMMSQFVDGLVEFYQTQVDLDSIYLELMLKYTSSGFMMLYRSRRGNEVLLSEEEMLVYAQNLVAIGIQHLLHA